MWRGTALRDFSDIAAKASFVISSSSPSPELELLSPEERLPMEPVREPVRDRCSFEPVRLSFEPVVLRWCLAPCSFEPLELVLVRRP
jgi:hypothetical protein